MGISKKSRLLHWNMPGPWFDDQAADDMVIKIKCPKCGYSVGIADGTVLHEVKRNRLLRGKVASMLGKLTGGQTKLDAEGRRQRALKAVAAREARKQKHSE